jgi:tRNA (mo5U34)-methyltransferase
VRFRPRRPPPASVADRARKAIAAVPKWHHRIEVAPGVVTPGAQDTPALLEQISMPDDLTGMRVLDIGARDGFFSFEAERRGAREVVALDNEPPEHTGFAVAKELLGSTRVSYLTENVYSLSPERYGRFDFVFFLGVIYHLRHPLLALDRIHDVCEPGAVLLVESHVIDEGLVDQQGALHRLADFNEALPSFTLTQYLPAGILGNDPTSHWAPSAEALRLWIHEAGFDVTHTWRVAFRGGATGRARDLAADSPRAVDEASHWDMESWHVEARTQM